MGMSTSRKYWTAAEIDALPADGYRYEVIDGERIVTPSPSQLHQQAVVRLAALLLPLCDAVRARLTIAPSDVKFSASDQVQPDLYVTARPSAGALVTHFTDIRRLLLAVEVLSPSSAHTDRVTKRMLYQANGVPEYWIVDTDACKVERWTPKSLQAELVSATLAWQLVGANGPTIRIDLVEYFRSVLGV